MIEIVVAVGVTQIFNTFSIFISFFFLARNSLCNNSYAQWNGYHVMFFAIWFVVEAKPQD